MDLVTTQALPDLTLVVKRDGTISSWTGGDASPALRGALHKHGEFSAGTNELLGRLARQCIANRRAADARLREADADYDLRVLPQSPDRVLMTVRPALPKITDNTVDDTNVQRPATERRGFTRLLRDRLSRAALRERPLTLAVIELEGTAGMARVIGSRVAERIVTAALDRIPEAEASGETPELIGHIGESVVALVLEQNDRRSIEQRLAAVAAALKQPGEVAGADYRLNCFIGVAVSEQGRSTPTELIDQASSAALEARRAGRSEAKFYSDTVRVRALDRIDIVNELRGAVERRELSLRFRTRCDLATGEAVASLSYLHWSHPLRGSIRPSDFLNIAEGTGLASVLSMAALESLCANFADHARGLSSTSRVSFGPLRDHVLEATFVDDLLRLLDRHGVPPERFELRIAERAFIACDPTRFDRLRARSIQLVVDEVGREATSMANLSRTSLWGLQVDRHWASAPADDLQARRVCRGISAMASGLGMESIATGIDDIGSRDRMHGLGYRYGTGDLYARAESAIQPVSSRW